VPSSHHRHLGYTLLELLVSLTLLGILASLAAPSMMGAVHRVRMQAALDNLSRDIFYARMLAVRSGRRVEMRFVQPLPPCVESYAIVVVSAPESEAKRVDVRDSAGSLCLRKNGPAVLAFSSRGRPNWNLSFWIRQGQMVDSLTLNQLGRLHRWK